MNENRPDSPNTSLSVGDVYFILFRQKWIILICSFLGIAGAAALLFVIKPPQYRSEAMISIRYVVDEKPLNVPGDQQTAMPLNQGTEGIINTELQILNSLDLAYQVAHLMTPERILGGGTNSDAAAAVIKGGITVEPIPESSVIKISFENSNRAMVQPVLSEVIEAYHMLHARLHRGTPDAFWTNESARLQGELAQTSERLRNLKNSVGVISVPDTEKAYVEQISRIRQDLNSAEADLSQRQAMLHGLVDLPKAAPRTEPTNVAATPAPPAEQVDQYRRVCTLLGYLEGKELNYLTQQGFTTNNLLVRQVREQIDENVSIKTQLEEKYPGLVAVNVSFSNMAASQPGASPLDPTIEREQVAALKARIQILTSQFNEVWSEATNFEKVKMAISELEQKQQLEQANLSFLMEHQEEARMDEALGVDKAANISVIQSPSSPIRGWSKAFKKKVAAVGAGGIFVGLALAFLFEMFLDRSIKRPVEIESKLRLPLLISIPKISKNGHRRLLAQKTENDKLEIIPRGASDPEDGTGSLSRRHPLRHFYEGLRDRLMVYFEVRNLTHSPKLVGITSCGSGAGVSSIATGLAASLSETGEGNVLLVDMNVEGGAARYFHKGKSDCGLESALKTETKESALVQENLYVATLPVRANELPQVLPKRFANLISRIKSSDYDYIIFDMPPVAETTMTFRLTRLMDMTLLVIEAEKTNQEVVKRVTSLLAESKTNVNTVLNKTRNYIPRRLHQEYLHET